MSERQANIFICPIYDREKVDKGGWWMPWLTQAMKDGISCDKRGVGANDLGSSDFRMGQPVMLKA